MLVAVFLVLAPTVLVLSIFAGYARSLQAARRSKLPYVSVPVFAMANWWFTIQGFVLPLLRRIPGNEAWIPLCGFFDLWHQGRTPFDRVKSDTFLTVSPQGNILWTSDPSVIMQLGKSCPSARLMCSPLNLYGPCIAGVKGEQTRLFRKVMAPFFNEGTHERIWGYALGETQGLLAKWHQPSTEARATTNMQQDALTLMLHVASVVFFSQPCHWDDAARKNSQKLTDGHLMDYDTALLSMVRLIWVIALTPKALLEIPAFIFKRANIAYHEWGQYMREMRDHRAKEAEPKTSGLDLLDTLVRACPELAAVAKGKHVSDDISEAPRLNNKSGLSITPEAVSGNMFLAILAGHETSAHTLALCLTVLACRPEIQEVLHKELDQILGSRPLDQWTYRGDCSALLQGYTGAMIYETLRVWPMAPAILKATEETERTIVVDGQTHVVPKSTLVLLHTTGAHTNPKHWDTTLPRETFEGEEYPFPLSSFDATRWLAQPKNGAANETREQKGGSGEDEEDETWMDAMRPENEKKLRLRLAEPGTFLPFSEGGSACIGSRMAAVEVVAALAAICSQYQVRLPVRQGESWEERRAATVRQMTAGMRFRVALHIGEPVALEFQPRRKNV